MNHSKTKTYTNQNKLKKKNKNKKKTHKLHSNYLQNKQKLLFFHSKHKILHTHLIKSKRFISNK